MLRGGLNPLRGPLVACRPASRLLSVQAQSQACRHSLGLLAINPEFSERIESWPPFAGDPEQPTEQALAYRRDIRPTDLRHPIRRSRVHEGRS